jgi:hypothetical protein
VSESLIGIWSAYGQRDGDHPALAAVGFTDRHRGPQDQGAIAVAPGAEHLPQSLGDGCEEKVVDGAVEVVGGRSQALQRLPDHDHLPSVANVSGEHGRRCATGNLGPESAEGHQVAP